MIAFVEPARLRTHKLRNWFAKIKNCDVYGAPGRQACAEHMEVGERALETYAALDVRRRVRRRLADGFNDNGEVSTGECLERNQILDAFLLSAGAVQIVEDYLQRDTLTLRRAAGAIGGTGSWALRFLAGAAEHSRRPRERAAAVS